MASPGPFNSSSDTSRHESSPPPARLAAIQDTTTASSTSISSCVHHSPPSTYTDGSTSTPAEQSARPTANLLQPTTAVTSPDRYGRLNPEDQANLGLLNTAERPRKRARGDRLDGWSTPLSMQRTCTFQHEFQHPSALYCIKAFVSRS